jgi:hypothetical protein
MMVGNPPPGIALDIVELIARSEWPIIVGGALLVFRRPIKELIARVNLTKIDAWGLKAEFERGLDKVEELAPTKEEAKLEEITTHFRENTAARMDWVEGLRPFLKDVTPEAVVLDTWSRVEGDMRAMTEALHPRVGSLWTPPLRFEAAAKEFGLSDEEIESLRVLRKLRNKIAHSADRSLTWDDAARFKRAAERLLIKMKASWEELRKK